jgi:hypothetical protein
LDLFPSSGEVGETPTLLGPLERANHNHAFKDTLKIKNIQSRFCLYRLLALELFPVLFLFIRNFFRQEADNNWQKELNTEYYSSHGRELRQEGEEGKRSEQHTKSQGYKRTSTKYENN